MNERTEIKKVIENSIKNKDFKNADLIRTRLNGIGVEIKDSPEGTAWEKNKK